MTSTIRYIAPWLAAGAAALAIAAAPIAAADVPAQPATIVAGPTVETVAHGGWHGGGWHGGGSHGRGWYPWLNPFGLPW